MLMPTVGEKPAELDQSARRAAPHGITGKEAMASIRALYGPDSRQARAPRWLTTWRELAELTGNMTQAAPIFSAVMTALDQCDTAFATDNWEDFQDAAALVRSLMAQAERY